MTSGPLLDVEHLSCVYEKRGLFARRSIRAVDDVSLTLDRGEILGLVGESGCGKSSLAKALVGIAPVEAPRLRFDDMDIALPLQRRPASLLTRLQYVFQDPLAALDPQMTAIDQVAEPLLIHRRASVAEAKRRASDALRLVNIGADSEDRLPHQLSGGQRQRVVLARALILEPDLLICDEPISALDVSIQAQIVALLARLRVERNLTILFISHGVSTVRRFCDRVAVMYLGRICEVGPATEIFERPLHPYTQALVAAVPPIHPRHRRHQPVLQGEAPDLAAIPSGCRFHPRCPARIAACDTLRPELLSAAGREVACHVAAPAVPS